MKHEIDQLATGNWQLATEEWETANIEIEIIWVEIEFKKKRKGKKKWN